VVVFLDKFADFPDESSNLQLISRDAEQAGSADVSLTCHLSQLQMIPPDEVQTSFVATVNQTSYTADEEQAQKAVVVFPEQSGDFPQQFF